VALSDALVAAWVAWATCALICDCCAAKVVLKLLIMVAMVATLVLT
jgi:hypothetical protein